MNKVQCLIVDDEPLAIEVIKAHISGIPQLEIVGTCNNAIEALEQLRQHSIDLMFLDIQMPLLTGIEFLKSLTHRPKVIFTTAFRDYALESYELDVVDYLLKPISFERFFKAINKYLSLEGVVSPSALSSNSSSHSHPELRDDYLDLNSNKKTHRIRLKDILYVESFKDYIQVHIEGSYISTKVKISDIGKELPDNFMRIHRSYIVNTTAITAFSTFEVELGELRLPIGSSYKKEVQQKLRRS